MAKFDVYRSPCGEGYLLDCQSDFLDDLGTRLAVPLLPAETTPRPLFRLNPVFEIENGSFVMATHLAGAVPTSALKSPVVSLAEDEFTIGKALDMLISGY